MSLNPMTFSMKIITNFEYVNEIVNFSWVKYASWAMYKNKTEIMY